MPNPLTRREACKAGVLSAAGLLLGLSACEQKPQPQTATTPPPSPAPSPSPAKPRSIVVYCSADTDLAKPILAEFTRRTSIEIEPVFDTEATKTTGLVNRLLQEKDRPRADVFWCSEPFGMIRLARAGVLDSSTATFAELSMEGRGGWPRFLRDQRWLDGPVKTNGPRWYGFGNRARVVVYNTRIIKPEDAPTDYSRFTLDTLKGRIGMARPQFGTTRGHMAMLVHAWGKGPFGDTLRMYKANGLRLYDGNASVVRAVANGEIHAGFTDSDDVFAGQREGWPVAMSFIKCPDPTARNVQRDHPRYAELQSAARTGTLLLPNTLARIKDGPASLYGRKEPGEFIDFLLGPDMQRRMAQSESHNIPVDPALAKELATWLPPEHDIAQIDYEDAADRMDEAMAICDQILG